MMSYADYLRSQHWQETREKALERAGGTCEACGWRKATQVHHKTYARVGDERPGDLQAVCRPCHQQEHPDKPMTGPGLAEWDCPRCENVVAEAYYMKGKIGFVCRCGNTHVKRMRSGVKSTRRAPEDGVPCEHCERVLANSYGVSQHMEAKHPEIEFDYIHPVKR